MAETQYFAQGCLATDLETEAQGVAGKERVGGGLWHRGNVCRPLGCEVDRAGSSHRPELGLVSAVQKGKRATLRVQRGQSPATMLCGPCGTASVGRCLLRQGQGQEAACGRPGSPCLVLCPAMLSEKGRVGSSRKPTECGNSGTCAWWPAGDGAGHRQKVWCGRGGSWGPGVR